MHHIALGIFMLIVKHLTGFAWARSTSSQLHITYTKEHLITALLDIFDIMYKKMDLNKYKSMINQLSAAELRKELPVEDDEMHEFMEPYLSGHSIK